MQPPSTWIMAASLALVVAIVAWRLRALTLSGGLAAAIVGTVVVGTGGWWSGVALVAFFVSSSLFSRIAAPQRQPQARGSRRDWVQVLANGWPVIVGGIGVAVTGHDAWVLFALGGIAAATADTWSSELGRHSATPPRLITTGQSVPPGTSGGVTWLGLGASLGGALLIGLIAATPFGWQVAFMIAIAGVTGGAVDSLLGATVQERRFCDRCQKATERNPHHCGSPTRIVGGVRHLDNDVVNGICGLIGAIIAAVSGIL